MSGSINDTWIRRNITIISVALLWDPRALARMLAGCYDTRYLWRPEVAVGREVPLLDGTWDSDGSGGLYHDTKVYISS
jgi:hypothetical protein